MVEISTLFKFKLLAAVVIFICVANIYHVWARHKSNQDLYGLLNKELNRIHERINKSLDYSHAIVEYFEPRHKELLVDDSNRLFLPAVPVQPAKEGPTDILHEKALANRERNTLLSIIAVLCKDAGYDYTKHAKTAVLIQSMAAQMGVSIGETTIEGHLKKIPDALGTRMK